MPDKKKLITQTIVENRIFTIRDTQVMIEGDLSKLYNVKTKVLNQTEPTKGILYNGQIFDAYQFIANIIRKTQTSTLLIDNYIDDTVLTLFSKRRKNVRVIIYL